MRINYRTSKEILHTAMPVLSDMPVDDLKETRTRRTRGPWLYPERPIAMDMGFGDASRVRVPVPHFILQCGLPEPLGCIPTFDEAVGLRCNQRQIARIA